MSFSLDGSFVENAQSYPTSKYDLVSMVSHHQPLIDSYDPDEDYEYRIKQEFTYPIYKKRKTTGLVVKFDGLQSGVVIEKGVGGTWEIGDVSDSWTVHTHERWLDWTPPPEDKPKTKTVYEWMLTRYDGSITLTNTVCTEEMASGVFADYLSYKKTGRSWEMEE